MRDPDERELENGAERSTGHEQAPLTDEEVAEVERGEREPGDMAEEVKRASQREEQAGEG